jgi:menaquinone-dependent protoporphyrinogen oxidase
MDKDVLVAYASKYGSTKEIAEKIGEVFREAGLRVHVASVDRIRDVAPYRAVVLGSAIYVGKWPREAAKFLQSHEKTLATRLFWLFASGPTGEGNPVKLVEGVRLPVRLQPLVDRLHPRDIAVFHGHIDPDKINFIERWAIKSLVKKPFGDFRDWDAIVAWASSIAASVREADPVP